jgi:hypothetical protein
VAAAAAGIAPAWLATRVDASESLPHITRRQPTCAAIGGWPADFSSPKWRWRRRSSPAPGS